MKRHLLLLAALGVSTLACGSSSSDGATAGGDVGVPAPGRAPDAVGATPTPGELDEDHGVFVAPGGDDSAVGTRLAPLATLGAATTAAKAHGKRVYACEGTYAEAVELANGVSMVGGLDCKDNTKWVVGKSRSKVLAPTSPALHAKDVSALTRIEGFDVTAPDGNDTDPSSIGLLAENATGVVLANMRVVAGKGKGGIDGVSGPQLTASGTPAVDSRIAVQYACPGGGGACVRADGTLVPRSGGAGATATCAGVDGFAPGAGGRGGSGGVYEAVFSQLLQAKTWNRYKGNPNQEATLGEALAGERGANGVDGTSGIGVFDGTGFKAGNGTAGTNGSPGGGGRGGDGKPPTNVSASTVPADTAWSGNDGAGGGAGGCPGLAGTPGTGGGASVAVLLLVSAIAVADSELVAADGGNGGRGTAGSNATLGSLGGVATMAGTGGAAGGDGGRAGVSGHGAGGPSFAVAFRGTAPSISVSTKSTVGKGGLGHEAEKVGTGTAQERTIPAAATGASETLHAL